MNSQKVRLEELHISAICDAFKLCFLKEDHLWVFGSRANLTKKGGDIDFFVETSLDIDKMIAAKLVFARELFFIFDEQKIDIITYQKGTQEMAIHKQARETGIQIA